MKARPSRLSKALLQQQIATANSRNSPLSLSNDKQTASQLFHIATRRRLLDLKKDIKKQEDVHFKANQTLLRLEGVLRITLPNPLFL